MSIADIRVLGNRLLIKRLEYEHPTLFVAGITLQKGIVVACGPGQRVKKKVRFDLQEGHMSTAKSLYFEDGDETGAIRPMLYKVGDIVEFSPRNQIEWEYEGEKYIWINAKACYGTSNDSTSEALLWQTSAGHDKDGNYLSGRQN